MPSLFDIPIGKLKLVGEKREKLYNKLGVRSVGELIYYFPRDYEDLSVVTDVFSSQVGENVLLKLTVYEDAHSVRVPSGKLLVSCVAGDDTGALRLVFFNNKFIKDKLRENSVIFVYGKITDNRGKKEMLSPAVYSENQTLGIMPIYPLTGGLSNNTVRFNVRTALNFLPDEINDPIPAEFLRKYDLMGLREALLQIHFPNDFEKLKAARKRFVFEELLVLNLGLMSIKGKNRELTPYRLKTDYSDEYFSSLPFVLTNAQKKAISGCIDDMLNSSHPMNKLLQGDVGSGKTAVATALCHTVIKNGYQCAFMAPTEILATQHYKNISKQLEAFNITVALLTGSTSLKEKRRIKSLIKSGDIQLVIGTHALLTDDVEFNRLALIITDEQHRFGVSQRSSLISKGENPHLLVMSATPIPRTLALIMYGDLDICILDEMPKGRQKINTYLVNSSYRHRAFNFLKDNIDKGHQCYIICPSVLESEQDIASAVAYYEKIRVGEFSSYRVGLLHGKMKANEKDSVMQAFSNGEIDVLVCTTVVEVGVDVQNATVIMIENAERFGLSQLHQLRGRVGRGESKSYCILLSDSKSSDSTERLKVMCKTNDGFKIADEDLKQRGPGDFFGARQHGLPMLKVASLSDTKSLENAQSLAKEIAEIGINKPEFSALRGEIKRTFGKIGDRLN